MSCSKFLLSNNLGCLTTRESCSRKNKTYGPTYTAKQITEKPNPVNEKSANDKETSNNKITKNEKKRKKRKCASKFEGL